MIDILIYIKQMYHHTVDGTNPSPVDMVNILYLRYFPGVLHIPTVVGLGTSEASTVLDIQYFASSVY